MNAIDLADYSQTLGKQAKAASAEMARASAATKNVALRKLAALLRANVAALQLDNAKDLERARAAGLAAPMVDRLKLTPQVLETCAQGCEQLAAMPEMIGEILGLKQQPSGIRVGQMRVPIGVFGMIFESRPNVTIEAASLSIKSGNACILRGGSEAIESNKALARLVQQALFVEDCLSLTKASKLSLAARRDWIDLTSDNLRTATGFDQQWSGDSYRAGLVHDLRPGVTLYGQWSKALEAPAQIVTLV